LDSPSTITLPFGYGEEVIPHSQEKPHFITGTQVVTTNYVVGFLFNDWKQTVVLIEKQKPDWQKGRLNGVGGKIEPGETPFEAMTREFEEETGVRVEGWNKFAVLRCGPGATVHFFWAVNGNASAECRSVTDENVGIYSTCCLPNHVMTNLPWLIPMALSMPKERAAEFDIREVYYA
jgi:8-oxo-dGTP diphosphatase